MSKDMLDFEINQITTGIRAIVNKIQKAASIDKLAVLFGMSWSNTIYVTRTDEQSDWLKKQLRIIRSIGTDADFLTWLGRNKVLTENCVGFFLDLQERELDRINGVIEDDPLDHELPEERELAHLIITRQIQDCRDLHGEPVDALTVCKRYALVYYMLSYVPRYVSSTCISCLDKKDK